MEFVDGQNVDDYLALCPEQTNEVFLQTISGFGYLERNGILHRDIRPGNLMVRTDGIVKIIDLGFGKEIRASKDFEKSISLNWWCQPPSEFEESRYDFRSEVYFVGKLFEKIIKEKEISHFKYTTTLGRMCHTSPGARIQGFAEIEKEIGSNQFFEIGFSDTELEQYRTFADALYRHITKIEVGSKYKDDIGRIETQLNDAYRGFMLEQVVPDAAVVVRCLLDGTYYYKKQGFPVPHVRDFLQLVKSSTEEKKRIIVANLHTKLDAVPRYSKADDSDEVPF
jgi:serine/threonine-protein kinase